MTFYAADLAYIHNAGFAGYAERAAPEILGLLQCARPIGAAGGRGGSERSTVRRRGPVRVVEIGCGGGIVARTLTDAGYSVVGIDISRAMIGLARARAPRATFRPGSWATARLPRCDAIVAVGEILNYDTGMSGAPAAEPAGDRHERDLRRFFARAFDSLRPGGLLVFDFMASARRRTYRHFSRAGKDWTLTMRAASRNSGALVIRQLVLTRTTERRRRRSRETHYVRIYPRNLMARMLEDAGFEAKMTKFIGRMPVFRSNVAAICIKPARQPRRPALPAT